jgi:chemosensory pili system protein ChpA (sensor histidine kinase/response regulator)
MVGALVIGDAAWSIENLLNRVIDGSIIMNKDIANLTSHVVDNIPALVESFETRTSSTVDVPLIVKQAEALANGDLVSGIGSAATIDDASSGSEDLSDDHEILGIDDALLEIFESEAALHVKSVEDFVDGVSENSSIAIDDDLSRALHTLKGSANTANIQPIAMIAIPA